MNLSPNSIYIWAKMEKHFHSQFYRMILEVLIANLVKIYQYDNESITQFVTQFKRARNRCFTSLVEKEFINLTFSRLKFNLSEKCEG